MPVYELAFSNYKLRDYERTLAIREVKGLLPTAMVSPNGRGVVVNNKEGPADHLLRRLSFFSRFRRENSDWERTLQNRIENLSSGKQRNIRYSGHSLHEYKGRFYPQLGKSLINASGIGPGNTVLDPFCGGGTLLLEAALGGISSIGIDVNPIGCMIARAKIASIKMRPSSISNIRERLSTDFHKEHVYHRSGLDMTYLSRWFPEENLHQALTIKAWINSAFSGDVRTFLHVILSDVLSIFSFQEPSEQRIRRRRDSPPLNLRAFFRSRVLKHLDEVEALSRAQLLPRSYANVSVYQGDVRKMSEVGDASVDCVITSPPYATALPYIDANRLSLFFFGFVNRREFSLLDQEMIGSREINVKARATYEQIICRGQSNLPYEISDFLKKIHLGNTHSHKTGFRKRNMAALLLRYFEAMQKSFREIYRVVKPGGNVNFVVGDNFTTVNEERTLIPTARFLNTIAQETGFTLKEMTPMTPPAAYNIYSKNAVKKEFISVLQRGK